MTLYILAAIAFTIFGYALGMYVSVRQHHAAAKRAAAAFMARAKELDEQITKAQGH
jgi:hypothetical protein